MGGLWAHLPNRDARGRCQFRQYVCYIPRHSIWPRGLGGRYQVERHLRTQAVQVVEGEGGAAAAGEIAADCFSQDL
jgi:hypothetical protein